MRITIRVNNLTKFYELNEPAKDWRGRIAQVFRPKIRRVHALRGISFECREGEIIGYLGPNGAGKSTTLKCLTGIIRPSSGTCEVLGMVPGRNRIVFNRHIGVMFGQRSMLFWDLPVIETLRLYKVIYDLENSEFSRNLTELSHGLSLDDLLTRPVRKLSFGQRIRCEVAVALLHFPQVVFLDEPTIGLDLEGKRLLRSFLLRYKTEHRATILLTTHQLDDVEAVCDRILLINKGELLFDGTLCDLRSRYGDTRVVSAEIISVRDESGLTRLLGTYPSSRNERIEITVPLEKTIEVVMQLLHAAEIHDLTIDAPKLESVVARWY